MSLSHPHPEPRDYTQMLRTWDWAPWRGIVGFLGLFGALFVVAPILLLPVLAAAIVLERPEDFGQAFQDAATLQSVTPASMLYLNLTLASAIVIVWGLMRLLHRMRLRWVTSVLPGMRWGFFAACVGLSLVALAASLIIGAFLPADPNDIGGTVNELTPKLAALAAVILLTTPLQAMGEEYAFRGYAMQALGALSKRPWVAIVVTSAMFAVAHGVQNAPLFLDRFIFGLMAGYVVLRTGGLEAGIALHIWNNLLAFGFALAFADIDSVLKVSEVSWWNLPLTLTQNGLYLVLVILVAKRMGLDTRTRPPVLASESASV